jgi:hypothetical protein
MASFFVPMFMWPTHPAARKIWRNYSIFKRLSASLSIMAATGGEATSDGESDVEQYELTEDEDEQQQGQQEDKTPSKSHSGKRKRSLSQNDEEEIARRRRRRRSQAVH